MDQKEIAYSLLELALVPEGGTMKETLNNTAVIAKVAEANNFKRMWFAEHHNAVYVGSCSPVMLTSYVAENTEKIRVGAGGVMLPNHSPLIIAEQFGTLAQLYPGRIDLGLGRAPGTNPQTAQAIRSDFFQAAQSFPKEIEKIQTYFSVENKNASIRAGIAEGADIEYYILGSSTDSAILAANKGLPYAFASHFASTHLFEALRIYRDNFQPSKFLESPYTILAINVHMADTDKEAEKLFSTQINTYIDGLTGSQRALQPPTELNPNLRGALQHPTLQQMLKYSFVGSKETVTKQIKEFLQRTQADELIIVCPTFYIEDRIKSISLFAEMMKEINRNKTVN